MRLLSLLWVHRLVLLLSLIVSAVVAAPFALRSQVTYTSTAQLFLPAADPVAGIVSDTSALSFQLQGYAEDELRGDARMAAGADAGRIVSLEAEFDPNENDVYQLTAKAETASMATTTIELIATAMRTEANRLLEEQFESFRENTTEGALMVFRDKRRLISLISAQEARVDSVVSEVEGLDQNTPEAEGLGKVLERERDLLGSYRLQRLILDHQQKNLIRLPATVGEQVAVAQGVSRVVSGPSTTATDTQLRVVQVVGAAVLTGLLAAVLVTLWLERDALRGDRRDSGRGMDPASPWRSELSTASHRSGVPVTSGDGGPDSSQGGSPRTRNRES